MNQFSSSLKKIKVEFPGFFDLQVNGFAGVDFNSPDITPDQLHQATGRMRATGVTRYLPTLITSSLERFSRCAQALLKSPDPVIAGIHMEGPYISPHEGARGAHPRDHIIEPSVGDFQRRQESAAGRIVLVTLAPEIPGALELIEYLVEANIRVAIGHTDASPEKICDAIRAGATLSTHLGNGCAPVLPRHPNLIWEQIASDELFASIIADGHHLPAATVKSIVRAKSPSRTMLVTDAVAAAGCEPGSYTLGDARVVLSVNGRISAPGSPHLAGSALAMPVAVANTVRFTGLPVVEVLPMASTLPASYMGIEPVGRVLAEWDQESYLLTVNRVMTDPL